MEEEKRPDNHDDVSKDKDEIRNLVEDKTQISIDNNPDKKFKPKEFKRTVKKNPWIMATIVLGIIALILLVLMLRGGITGNIITGRAIGGQDAGDKLIDYLNERTGGGVEYISHEDVGDLYEVLVLYQGQELPVYITKDGSYFVQGAVPLDEPIVQDPNQQPPADVVKSDKPIVELAITSHCPYGTQGSKGILPVFKLLGDKIDSGIRYFNIPSHGEKEKVEAERSVCIREQQNDKFFEYWACILEGDGNPDANGYMAESNDPEVCIKEVGIDKTKLDNCLQNDIQNYYSGNSEIDLGVGSSPTLIINGQQVQSGRSPAAYLETICSAFNDAPEECNEVLSSATPSVGFGYTASAGGSTNAQC